MAKSYRNITKEVVCDSIDWHFNNQYRWCCWWYWIMLMTTAMICCINDYPLLVVVASELPEASVSTSFLEGGTMSSVMAADANSFDVGGHYMARIITSKHNIAHVKNDDDHQYQRILSDRIVGGTQATRSDYPWFGIPSSNYTCGASLIQPDIMISAAHCVDAFIEAEMRIGISVRFLNNSIDYVPIRRLFIHRRFKLRTYENDIMLIQLVRPVNTTLIPLVSYNTNPMIPITNQSVRAIGFGTTMEDGILSRYLLQVDLNIVNDTKCYESFIKKPRHLRPYKRCMICANGIGKDACEGDSGGPLFIQKLYYNNITNTNSTKNIIIGLTSWGNGCARLKFPGIYTKVSYYTYWIRRGIKILTSNTTTR